MERPVNPVHRDPPESLVHLDRLEREDLLEQLALKAEWERREQRESLEWKEPKEKQGPSAPRDHQASKVQKACVVFLVQWESKVYLVHLAQTDHQDPWAPQDYQV